MFQLEKRHQIILLIIAAVVLFGAGIKYADMQNKDPLTDKIATTRDAFTDEENENGAATNVEDTGEADTSALNDIVTVHVAGAVQNPGVYRLPAGSRVVDAVEMAGSTADSALDYLNLAEVLEDGRQITIYSLEQVNAAQTPSSVESGSVASLPQPALMDSNAGNTAGLININTASQTALQELPGIGPAMSQRIIDYRDQNGGFATIEDVQNVSGIGEKRYAQIKDLICVK